MPCASHMRPQLEGPGDPAGGQCSLCRLYTPHSVPPTPASLDSHFWCPTQVVARTHLGGTSLLCGLTLFHWVFLIVTLRIRNTCLRITWDTNWKGRFLRSPQACSIRVSGVRPWQLLLKQCPGVHTHFPRGNCLTRLLGPHLTSMPNCIRVGLWRQKEGVLASDSTGKQSSLLCQSEAACLRGYLSNSYSLRTSRTGGTSKQLLILTMPSVFCEKSVPLVSLKENVTKRICQGLRWVAFLASSAQAADPWAEPMWKMPWPWEGWEVWLLTGNHVNWILGESGKLELVVTREGLLRGPYLLAGGR